MRGSQTIPPNRINDRKKTGVPLRWGASFFCGKEIPAAEAAYKPFVPRSYAYCSDTAPFPEEAAWLRGTDVLYHEATYLQEYADQAALRHHSTTLQAAKGARSPHRIVATK